MSSNALLEYQRLLAFVRQKSLELDEADFWEWFHQLDEDSAATVLSAMGDPAFALQFFQIMPDLDEQAYHWEDAERTKRKLQYDSDGNPITWRTWFLRMGRGTGKTHAAATNINLLVEYLYPGMTGLLVGPTNQHVREVMIEGPSGLIETARPDFKPVYQPMYSRVMWPNGSKALIYTADNPQAIRGPTVYWAWGDELAKWKSEESYKNMVSALRNKHEHGNRLILTTSPIASQRWVRDIEADPATITTVATSFDNVIGLDEGALAAYRRRVESGDKKAREEYLGEWIDEGTKLWTIQELDLLSNKSQNISLKDFCNEMDTILLGIDPGGRIDLTGLVLIGKKGNFYWVLGDWSMPGSKEKWEQEVLMIAKQYMRDGDRVVVETNKHMDADIDLRRLFSENNLGIHVYAKHQPPGQGKTYRAQRAQQLYEKAVVKHFRVFADLHKQMEDFYEIVTSGKLGSPDRVDALCMGLNWLQDQPTSSMNIIFTSLQPRFDH